MNQRGQKVGKALMVPIALLLSLGVITNKARVTNASHI